jgi:hypothetical protein
MPDGTPTQAARHSSHHLEGRHSAYRRNGIPVAAWVPVPPQYHGGRHRAGLITRLAQAIR